MTTVVRIKRKTINNISTIIQDCDVYIGRRCTQGGWNLPTSIWHNPYSVKEFGRAQCLILYRDYILNKIKSDPVTYDLNTLVGKRLGCWCDTCECHGYILLELIDTLIFK
jgi:hypothetical protein